MEQIRDEAKNKQVWEDKSNTLPLDVIHNILLRLPVKSLLKLKTVSKSWNNIISSPEFIKSHLDHSKKSKSEYLFLCEPYIGIDDFVTRFENLKFHPRSTVEFPMERYPPHILCSCEGLLLLIKNHGEIYYVWNPSTRTYTNFWSPYRVNYDTIHGFCYDSSTDDYKVVVVCTNWYAVYSCKTNTWTKKKEMLFSGISRSSGVFYNGKLYWVVIQRESRHSCYTKYYNHSFIEFDGGVRYPTPLFRDFPEKFEFDYSCAHEIAYFDPVDDSFKKFERPRGVVETDMFYLTTLRSYLSLYRISHDRRKVEIWTVKGGINDLDSWSKLLSVANLPVTSSSLGLFVQPIILTKENQVILYVKHFGQPKCIVYDLKTESFETVDNVFAGRAPEITKCLASLSVPPKKCRPKRLRGTNDRT